MKIFKLPDLGEGLQEAEIVEWHVHIGDEVRADQPMVSVETAKAVVEIPAPYTARVERIFGEAGEIAHVGAPLIGFEGEDTSTASVTVVGRVESSGEVLAAAPVPPRGHASGVKAAPAVRALADRLGVDLALVGPTGAEGTISMADVERAAGDAAGLPPLEPLRGIRRTMAQSMTTANAQVCAVTVVDDADIEAWTPGDRALPRLVRALIAAARAEPALNAHFDPRGMGRRMMSSVNIGLAVDAEDGLLVPVLRAAEHLHAEAMDAALANLVQAARARSLPPEAMSGATITLTNFGSIAGRYATPVVVPPTVAILGAGRIRDDVVARDRRPVVRRILPLSLTFDHRCVTGGEAARFLAAVISDLELAQ